MLLTENKLRQIIKEEYEELMKEIKYSSVKKARDWEEVGDYGSKKEFKGEAGKKRKTIPSKFDPEAVETPEQIAAARKREQNY